MVDIAPFRALRFSSEQKHADISEFICPPYDVISPSERATLVEKSKNNVVQLELPEGQGDDRYGNASHLLEMWKSQEVLQQDRRPSFYLLETRYRIKDAFAPDKELKRYGVMSALRLEVPGKGSVRPHEKTLPKAKEDRLKLLSAVQTNISPIFGLFFDSNNEWKPWIEKTIKESPIAEGEEHSNLKHKMWKITDPDMITKLQEIMKRKELYIADGHHRYEVAWAYKDIRSKGNTDEDLPEGWKYVMAYICPMEEPGLLMLPTHRLVKTNKTFEEWKKYLETVFEITPVTSLQDMVRTLSAPSKRRQMGWVTSKGPFLLSLRSDISIDRCIAHRPEALRTLDVVLLHDIALAEAPGIDFLPEKELEYTRDMDEIQKRTVNDPSWVAFILSSPGVESLARVASAGEVMPPKTTYFYPKVPTGFTLMPLDRRIP